MNTSCEWRFFLMLLARFPVRDLDVFAVSWIAIEHVRNVQWLAGVADVVRQNASGAYKTLCIARPDRINHLVIDLPAPEWEQSFAFVLNLRIIVVFHPRVS